MRVSYYQKVAMGLSYLQYGLLWRSHCAYPETHLLSEWLWTIQQQVKCQNLGPVSLINYIKLSLDIYLGFCHPRSWRWSIMVSKAGTTLHEQLASSQVWPLRCTQRLYYPFIIEQTHFIVILYEPESQWHKEIT